MLLTISDDTLALNMFNCLSFKKHVYRTQGSSGEGLLVALGTDDIQAFFDLPEKPGLVIQYIEASFEGSYILTTNKKFFLKLREYNYGLNWLLVSL